MGVTATLTRLVPSVDGPSNLIRSMWDKLHRLPGGKRVFSRAIGMAAPYTNTIGAVVVDLGDGHSEVCMRDRRAVRNHLRCIHAIALCNLAELTANVALGYSLPDDGRFIVAGLSIEYVKKSRGTITATCDCPDIGSSAEREYQVPVVMRNPAGEIVATASLRTLVGPKPPR